MNKFELKIQETGYGFPCMICAHNIDDAKKCRKCSGYEKVNEQTEYDIRKSIQEAVENAMDKL